MEKKTHEPRRLCPYCRSSVLLQAKFCQRCGKDVDLSRASHPVSTPGTIVSQSRSHVNTLLISILLGLLVGGIGIAVVAGIVHSRPTPQIQVVATPVDISSAPVAPSVPAHPPAQAYQPSTAGSAVAADSQPIPTQNGDNAPQTEAGVTQQQAPPAPFPVPVADQTLKPAPTSQGITVCIDPGHPSEVGRGTQGKHITEIQAVWAVALKLQAVLEQHGIHVVKTKDSEQQFVRNKDRAYVANQAHAALMIRLHCDANAGSGVATYAPDRQGVSGGKRGPDPSVIQASQQMELVFHPAMIHALRNSLPDRGMHPDTETHVGGQQGALTGSIYSQVPVLLVEMCVLTNPHDEAFIETENGQQKMAQAIAQGVLAALQERRQ